MDTPAALHQKPQGKGGTITPELIYIVDCAVFVQFGMYVTLIIFILKK